MPSSDQQPTEVPSDDLAKRQKRWQQLYRSLDTNADGIVDIEDLTKALKRRGSKVPVKTLIERLFRKKTKNEPTSQDCTLDFREFVDYIKDHESHLAVVFGHIDINKDGIVQPSEIREYMQKLGILISLEKAELIVKKMRTTSTGVVNLDAFQEYMMLHPSSDPLDIAQFWQHNLIVDVGEDSLVPENFHLVTDSKSTWWRHLLAGAIAGGVSRSITAPMDRLKIFLQVHANHFNKFGPISGLKTLLNEGGFRSMWRGNGINVLKIAPETALKFTLYEKIKCYIKQDRKDELSIGERLLAGSMAGASAQSLIYPMEVMKVRLALRKTGEFNHGMWQAAREIYFKEGPRAFYRGYVPNLWGIVPYAGIDLAVYETLKRLYMKHYTGGRDVEPSIFILLACGSFSAVCGQVTSYPFSLVKTKLQSNAESKLAGHPTRMLGQFRYILQNEGFFGLYCGLTPGIVKIIPAVSISYVIYEHLRKSLGAKMS